MSEQPLLAEVVGEVVDNDTIERAARRLGITTEEAIELFPKTWEESHAFLRWMADKAGEWAGMPMPMNDFPLRVEDRYPYKDIIEQLNRQADSQALTIEDEQGQSIGRTVVRNSWYSKRGLEGLPGWVYLYQLESSCGDRSRIRLAFRPTTRGAGERARMWLNTAGVARAWDAEAEFTALLKLQTLVPPHIYHMYFMTGAFLETSQRSGMTYVFRKNRPTIAMRGDKRTDQMRTVAALCLHPIAYYEGTWAGAMCPTDDVIAHLLMMRGDEYLFWKRSNHHNTDSPEAGI